MGYRSVTARLELGKRLRAARNEAGMSTTDAAKFVEVAQSSVSRIETGRMPVNARQLALLAEAYQVGGEELADWERLLRDGNGSDQWWTRSVYASYLTTPYTELIEVEDAAERLISTQAQLVPGLLQTQDYFQALCNSSPFRIDFPNQGPQDLIEIGGDIRRMRQRRLLEEADSSPLSCQFLLSVAVLDFMYGSPEVHLEQLEWLLRFCGSSNVEILFIPYDRMFVFDNLDMYHLPGDGAPVVFGESMLTNTVTEKGYPFSIRKVRAMIETAQRQALGPAESTSEIEQRIDKCLRKSSPVRR